jgi:Arc-like DNA binding domain
MMTIQPITLMIGIALGAVVAWLGLMERPRRLVVYLRLPEELHHQLSEAATAHGWDLKAEIITRLQASLGS